MLRNILVVGAFILVAGAATAADKPAAQAAERMESRRPEKHMVVIQKEEVRSQTIENKEHPIDVTYQRERSVITGATTTTTSSYRIDTTTKPAVQALQRRDQERGQ